jgi:hypothetical protein
MANARIFILCLQFLFRYTRNEILPQLFYSDSSDRWEPYMHRKAPKCSLNYSSPYADRSAPTPWNITVDDRSPPDISTVRQSFLPPVWLSAFWNAVVHQKNPQTLATDLYHRSCCFLSTEHQYYNNVSTQKTIKISQVKMDPFQSSRHHIEVK